MLSNAIQRNSYALETYSYAIHAELGYIASLQNLFNAHLAMTVIETPQKYIYIK